jgi:type I restriction enzyme R subunit
VVDLKLLYERPFTDIHEGGLDGIFSNEQADELISIVRTLNQSAILRA